MLDAVLRRCISLVLSPNYSKQIPKGILKVFCSSKSQAFYFFFNQINTKMKEKTTTAKEHWVCV